MKASGGKGLRGFKIADEKGIQKEAKAFIQNKKIIIPLNKNEMVTEVLYAWEPYTNANLVNGENLPASTFKIRIQ